MNAFRPYHAVLLVLLLLIVAATMMIEGVWTKRNYEFLPDMVTSVAVDAQSDRWRKLMAARGENPADGSVSRSDTVRADRPPFVDAQAGDSLAGAQRARVLPRGRAVYDVFCLPCHGAAGDGDGEITRRGYPPPPSLRAANARALSDSALYRIVSAGRGNMPSYAAQLTPADRWTTVIYLRSLQQRDSNTGESTP
ncbi:MAG: c-type cytochrome [Bacteroidota bacterium]|nr:c-type cytochrome [Bacteroidota bacterium]